MQRTKSSINHLQTFAPFVYVILVNWNGWKDLTECLDSLLGLDFDNYVAVVCDNCSSDGSYERMVAWSEGEALTRRDPKVWELLGSHPRRTRQFGRLADLSGRAATPGTVYWLDIGRNAGFAAASNAGLVTALADTRMTHAWILNSDTVVHPDALSALLARSQVDSKVGLVGSTLVSYWNPDEVQALGVHFDIRLGRGYEIHNRGSVKDLPSKDQVEKILTYIPGASMLVARGFLEVVGLMYEGFFLYFEELDWAVRADGLFTLSWAPGSIVYHKEGASIGTANNRRASDTSIYYQSVNLLRFVRRHKIIFLPFSLARLGFVAARFLIRGDRRAATIVLIAILDFAKGRRREGPIYIWGTRT